MWKYPQKFQKLLICSFSWPSSPRLVMLISLIRRTTVPYWLRFKGLYIWVWCSNPKLCNFFRITGNPSFKSRIERFIKQLCRVQKKSFQEIFSMVQVNRMRRSLLNNQSWISDWAPDGRTFINLLYIEFALNTNLLNQQRSYKEHGQDSKSLLATTT